MNKGLAALLIIVLVVGTGAFVTFVWNPFALIPGGGGDDGTNITVPTGTKFSKFSFPLYAEDTRTATASMTVTAWYDSNKDGKMQYNELRSLTDSSGTYTSNKLYPISNEDNTFDIWLQYYGSGYQVGYAKVHIYGEPAADLTALPLDEDVYIRTTDDSLTYAGQMNSLAWDDASDYNASLSGESGTAKVIFELSTADKGISSNIWESQNYMNIYSDLFPASDPVSDFTEGFWLKWDQITSDKIDVSQVLAPDFFGIYMTIQDKVDLGITVGDFDYYGDDNTNWYGMIVVSSSWGDLMYNTGDSPAPRPELSFGFSGCSASGTTVATYGVAIRTGLTYVQMVSFKWTASAAYYLGTPGDDWDWTHV